MTQPARRKRVPFGSEEFEKMMDEVFSMPNTIPDAGQVNPENPIERLRQAAERRKNGGQQGINVPRAF